MSPININSYKREHIARRSLFLGRIDGDNPNYVNDIMATNSLPQKICIVCETGDWQGNFENAGSVLELFPDLLESKLLRGETSWKPEQLNHRPILVLKRRDCVLSNRLKEQRWECGVLLARLMIPQASRQTKPNQAIAASSTIGLIKAKFSAL